MYFIIKSKEMQGKPEALERQYRSADLYLAMNK
jgi:hypothetical protein